MSAEEAAAMIPSLANVGMSGFTGSGYPKAVPTALANRIRGINEKAAAEGKEKFQIGVWTGASTAPELDGALAQVDGIKMRLPFNSDPIVRDKINKGQIEYCDLHLSHVAQHAWFGFLGKLSWAVIEVTGITPDGLLSEYIHFCIQRPDPLMEPCGMPIGGVRQPVSHLAISSLAVPSTSVGNNMTWLNLADNIIIEVNNRNPAELEGMHDVYYGVRLPPHRRPIMLTRPHDRIGEKYFTVDPTK